MPVRQTGTGGPIDADDASNAGQDIGQGTGRAALQDTGARIQVLRDGQADTLFGGALAAPASPSSSLLVETQRLSAVGWLTHRIPSQVLTMFLQPTELLHASEGGPVTRFAFQANEVALCVHEQEESVRWSAGAEVVCVSLDHARIANAAEELVPGGRFEMLPMTNGQAPRLAALLHALHAEQASGFAAGRLFVDGIEIAIGALLATRQNALAGRVEVERGTLTPHCMKRVIDYIEDFIDTPLSLAELASCAGLSEGHFSRLFRATFHKTPHQFVLRRRIERAKALLASSSHSIIDLGLMCGFSNPQHFSRVFHTLVGLPPSAFRLACQ
jgi:AraC family transcriptional regulator